MKQLVYLAALIIFVGLSFQIYSLDKQRRSLSKELGKANEELNVLQKDNKDLNDKLNYYSDPHNLEKELRARLNYKLPNEKLIIVVPKENSTSTAE